MQSILKDLKSLPVNKIYIPQFVLFYVCNLTLEVIFPKSNLRKLGKKRKTKLQHRPPPSSTKRHIVIFSELCVKMISRLYCVCTLHLSAAADTRDDEFRYSNCKF
jgi:hypothetical protein